MALEAVVMVYYLSLLPASRNSIFVASGAVFPRKPVWTVRSGNCQGTGSPSIMALGAALRAVEYVLMAIHASLVVGGLKTRHA
jgi:hypothetical protein